MTTTKLITTEQALEEITNEFHDFGSVKFVERNGIYIAEEQKTLMEKIRSSGIVKYMLTAFALAIPTMAAVAHADGDDVKQDMHNDTIIKAPAPEGYNQLDSGLFVPDKDSTQLIKPEIKLIKLETGFNGIDPMTGIKDLDVKLRLFENAALDIGPVELGYWSMHEYQDNGNYFSRNVPMIGFKDGKTHACAVLKVDQSGLLSTMGGVRDEYVIKKIGADYGWATVGANFDGTELAFFAGKEIGKKTSIEMFEALNIGFDGKISNYTELQFNVEVAKHIGIVVRADYFLAKDFKQKGFNPSLKDLNGFIGIYIQK